MMRYGHIPYHVLRGSEPLTELDRFVIIQAIMDHFETESTHSPFQDVP